MNRSIRVLTVVGGIAVLTTGVTRPLAAQFETEINQPGTVMLPDVQRVTLDEARAMAQRNNTQLLLGRLNVQAAGHGASAAVRDYFPKILGTAAAMYFDEPLGTVVSTQGRQLGNINVAPRSIAVDVINQDTAYAALMVAQPLTKLIGVSALVDIARADEAIAAAQLDKGTRDLLSGVTQAYHGLLAAQRIQAALSLQANALEPLLQSHPTAELKLASLELRKGMADAQQQAGELNEVLNQLIGFPPGTFLELSEPMLRPVPVNSADEAAALALANNPQVREARQNIVKARAGLRATRMEYIPDVNVVGGYTRQTAADYIQDDFTFVGVTGSYTFLDWGKRRETARQRETQIMLASHNVKATRETVELDARKAWLAYMQAHEALQIAGEVVAVHREAESAITDPAKLIAAKGATAKAELDQLQADVNFRLAHAKLLATIGQP